MGNELEKVNNLVKVELEKLCTNMNKNEKELSGLKILNEQMKKDHESKISELKKDHEAKIAELKTLFTSLKTAVDGLVHATVPVPIK